MTVKNYLFRFYILFLLHYAGSISGMDAPVIQLRPIDRVFLNACKNNTDINFALGRHANPKSIDPENGYAGIHYACKNNNLERVKWFLRYDMNLLTILTHDGLDPVDVAIKFGYKEIAQYIVDMQFIYASKTFSGPYFQLVATQLINRGANINAKTDDLSNGLLRGFTPLLYACMDGEIEKVQFLLSHGADVNEKSAIGVFPLYVIFSSMTGGKNESKRLELTKILLQHNADLSLIGTGNHSILAVAVSSGSIECVNLLLSKNIEVNIVDESGHNALYEAVFNNIEVMIPVLFDAGVKPISSKRGQSLAHLAAIRNNVSILKELIARGLSVNLVDNDGQAPLHYASEFAGVEVIKILLDAGAHIDIADKDGNTPLMIAKKNKDKHVFAYLQKESRSPARAQKRIQAEGLSVLSEDKKKEKPVVEPSKNTPVKKNKKKKKKKKKDPIVVLAEDQASPAGDTSVLSEVQSEPVIQSEVAPLETEPAPSENLAEQSPVAALSKIKKIKPAKKSLIDRVQEKVVDTFVTPQTKKSFAQAAQVHHDKQTKKLTKKKMTDDNLEIVVRVDREKQLMSAGTQENPLVKVITYSGHVEEKRNNPGDYFHNFSPNVEKEFGYLAQQKIIKPATKRDSAKIEYTIPAEVKFIGTSNYVPGAFEFVVQNEAMLHRFFKPDKKVHKKKLPLMLPPIGNGDSMQLPK